MNIMLRLITFIISLTIAFSCHAGDEDEFKEFIPTGWKLYQSTAESEFSDTPLKFTALILENTDPANYKDNEDGWPKKLNVNPRRLIILLKTSNGYKEILHNDKLIPSEHDEDNQCLSDPIQSIEISKGILTIPFEFWVSCGSYAVYNEAYKFRYDKSKNDFRLIGVEDVSSERNDDEDNNTYTSINYLTGKEKVTYHHKDTWRKIDNSKSYYLSDFARNQLEGRYG